MFEAENEEEVESEEDYESEESEWNTCEDIKKEVASEKECSRDELNGVEEIIRMHDGWFCCCFIKVCRKWTFERN